MSTKSNLFARTVLAMSVALLGIGGTASATNIVPDELMINHGGFDWVWASPCSADCSPRVDPSAGGTDWAFPIMFPELAQPLLDIGTQDPNYYITNVLWPNYNLFAGRCAATIFDVTYNHCDASDAAGGRIAPDGIVGSVWETWLVRRAGDAPAPVPAPASLALLGLGLAGLAWSRRKKA